MKHKELEKEKSPVKQLRAIRDKIGEEIQDMSYKQLMQYVHQKMNLKTKHNWS